MIYLIEKIEILYFNQRFENSDAADRVIRAYVFKNRFANRIQLTQKWSKVDEVYVRMFVCRLVCENKDKNVMNENNVYGVVRVHDVGISFLEVVTRLENMSSKKKIIGI